MSKKQLAQRLRKMIAAVEDSRLKSLALANKHQDKNFEWSVIADEAAWGIHYAQQSLTRLLEVVESSDAPTKGHIKTRDKTRW